MARDLVGVDVLGAEPEGLHHQVGGFAGDAVGGLVGELPGAALADVPGQRLAPHGVGEHGVRERVVGRDADQLAQHGLDLQPAVVVRHRLGAQPQGAVVLGCQFEGRIGRRQRLFRLFGVEVAVADLDPGAYVTGVLREAAGQEGPGLVVALEFDQGLGLFEGGVRRAHSFRFFFR